MIWKKLVIIKKGSEIYIREMVNLRRPFQVLCKR